MTAVELLIQEFIAYLKSMLGHVYVWGAKGENLTNMKDPESWIEGKEKKNGDSYVKRALKRFAEVLKSGKKPILAFDCSGLVTYWLKNIKGLIPKTINAQGLYTLCTHINKTDLKPGDLVFIYSKSKGKMGHVGVYIGLNTKGVPCTIESYGRDKGVVELPLASGEWTNYGRLPFFIEDNKIGALPEVVAPPVLEDEGKDVIILASSKAVKKPYEKGQHIKLLQTALNALGFDCGIADGSWGPNSAAGLDEFISKHPR